LKTQLSEDISCRRLEIFLAYMRGGSLAAAGEMLGMSAVSVHRALHGLQDGLRCSLFRHEGRRLVPTEAAHVLAQVAEDILGRLERGIESTRQAAGYSAKRLRIGSLYSLTGQMLPALIKAMEARKPQLQCELVLGRSRKELVPKLRLGELDAIYAEVPEADPEMVSLPMFEDEVYFAAALDSPYAARDWIDLAQCAGERVVTLMDSPFAAGRLSTLFPEFEPTLAMEVEDIFTLLNLVANGFAYALVPGRIRGMFQHNVKFLRLMRPPQVEPVRQTIGLTLMRARERDPNLLTLLSVSRLFVRERVDKSVRLA
jgi:LysR family malonate utilization transcriptional regulator